MPVLIFEITGDSSAMKQLVDDKVVPVVNEWESGPILVFSFYFSTPFPLSDSSVSASQPFQ